MFTYFTSGWCWWVGVARWCTGTKIRSPVPTALPDLPFPSAANTLSADWALSLSDWTEPLSAHLTLSLSCTWLCFHSPFFLLCVSWLSLSTPWTKIRIGSIYRSLSPHHTHPLLFLSFSLPCLWKKPCVYYKKSSWPCPFITVWGVLVNTTKSSLSYSQYRGSFLYILSTKDI